MTHTLLYLRTSTGGTIQHRPEDPPGHFRIPAGTTVVAAVAEEEFSPVLFREETVIPMQVSFAGAACTFDVDLSESIS